MFSFFCTNFSYISVPSFHRCARCPPPLPSPSGIFLSIRCQEVEPLPDPSPLIVLGGGCRDPSSTFCIPRRCPRSSRWSSLPDLNSLFSPVEESVSLNHWPTFHLYSLSRCATVADLCFLAIMISSESTFSSSGTSPRLVPGRSCHMRLIVGLLCVAQLHLTTLSYMFLEASIFSSSVVF